MALEDAVDFLKIEKTIPFHRAFDDTYYTAEVMKKMDLDAVSWYESVDYHRPPQTREEEIFRDFKTYQKFVSKTFATKEEMMADKVVTSLKCTCCGLPVWRRVRWFSAGANTYLALAQCPRHGYVKGKIRIKKAADGNVFAGRKSRSKPSAVSGEAKKRPRRRPRHKHAALRKHLITRGSAPHKEKENVRSNERTEIRPENASDVFFF